jgi:methyl-accepting chemotaxis protein
MLRKIRTSVQTKIITALILVFLVLMLATTWHMATTERAMVSELAEEKALDTASSYFDGVNTMMLTGSTAQREVLRQKVLAHDDITETRIIRGPEISKVFGAGNPEQGVIDDLDRRALEGEQIIEHGSDANGRVVTVLEPIVASSDFRGTNCLNCHVVAEGTVLGATRVSYSLANLDARITNHLLVSGGLNVAMLIVAVGVMAWLLHAIVVKPLCNMRETMTQIASDSDLTQRLDETRNDEIGSLSHALNSMFSRFSDSLHEVLDTTTQLKTVAGQITQTSAQTTQAAEQQRGETDMVATAITELESTAMQVREGATSAADASIEADKTANDGATTTRAAIDGIHALVSEIERAADVIEQLDQRSQSVGGVLDVIKSIAEQTNLLALNAAIEAARAGEKGRGFAVVADEVRTLATRSHESTQEIENIVEKLQFGARDAVEAMTQAKRSAEERREQVESADSGLNLIAERVARIRDLNAQMASAAHEQSTVTQDVSRNVVNISQLAERTAIDAEQTTEVSNSLGVLSDQLESLVRRFRF